jgi:aspartate-semialdehyde dehydrogenase
VPRRALRIAIAGATGTLGGELLSVLDARHFPVGELVLLATPRSAGDAIEFRGEVYDVATDASRLRGVDLAFLCTPPAGSLELARRALHEQVPCIDLSGALSGSPEVPLLVADLDPGEEALVQPVLSSPASPALAWAIVLRPLDRAAGLRRVTATSVHSASSGGRLGIESLSSETIALFNQGDPPEPTVFGQPVAFDCVPCIGEIEPAGATSYESALARDLQRILGSHVVIAATAVRVPTFSGDGAALALEFELALDPEDARSTLAKAPAVELWEAPIPGPATRATTGRESVLVGRLRADPSRERGLMLWLAADSVRLAATNAVKLAEARLALA